MNATQEWLQYIESQMIMDRYNISGYNEQTDTDCDNQQDQKDD